LVSSEKHEGTLGTDVEGRSGDVSGIRTAMVEWAGSIRALRGLRSAADSLSSENHSLQASATEDCRSE
jgi:hypothetical protein